MSPITRIYLALACAAIGSIPNAASGQNSGSLLTSREQLTAAATKAEQSGNPLQAAALRRRLREGDFQVGDRIVLTIVSDTPHTDTLLVRPGTVIDLPGKAVLPLTGVLRSEVKDLVTAEVLKYVKAEGVDVTPLTRIAVLGEVAHPGYFAFGGNVPITDAIMLAGGPTAAADIERTVVKRQGREYRSTKETRLAVTQGLTLDQLGLNAGDELVVGRHRQLINPVVTTVIGMGASLITLFIAASRH
jgi:protein involved in polysaccharide export with SLBB domain